MEVYLSVKFSILSPRRSSVQGIGIGTWSDVGVLEGWIFRIRRLLLESFSVPY